MSNDGIVSTLNELIENCRNIQEGYKICLEHLNKSNPELDSVLAENQFGCAAAISELQELVRSHGGEPLDGSSIADAWHRQWLKLKIAISGNDDASAWHEFERASNSGLRGYRSALGRDLPGYIELVVERQHQDMLRYNDKIIALREQTSISA